MSAYRPDWELNGLRNSRGTSDRRYSDGVDGCPQRVSTSEEGYPTNPVLCPTHHVAMDREVAR